MGATQQPSGQPTGEARRAVWFSSPKAQCEIGNRSVRSFTIRSHHCGVNPKSKTLNQIYKCL
ncbi:hypothetical protein E2C01_086965 [Portunus trituberculatus]|uniref:Uncharacterized protein n=1 Tax=Portunus trituberculatus TaxID=210409 RepID=A0A5B7J6R1_PORTR|nr:hypothetical protein [Portunus trituberculatus]